MKKDSMNGLLLTLRNRNLSTPEFRKAAEKMSVLLLRKLKAVLNKDGVRSGEVSTVIILRAAVAMLPPMLHMFPGTSVGVLGLRRDEHTKRAHWYYEKLPPISKKSIIVILDPMLATGGSASAAVSRLILRGADPRNIYFVGVIAAPSGVVRLAQKIPESHIILSKIDEGLGHDAMIVPRLGDFGDRYFGNIPTRSKK